MKKLVIIPARYASTRFPGKPLVDIGGMTMIERVWQRVRGIVPESHILIATDDDRIRDKALSFGAQVVMTDVNHPSGTDRVYEAYQKAGIEADVIVNVQGDEPFVDPSQINAVFALFENPAVEIGTLVKSCQITEIQDPNRVKTVVSTSGRALYFSRSEIPFPRSTNPQQKYYKHIGLYGYRPETLKNLVNLQPSNLELTESLEQLRWLENDFIIYTAKTEIETPSVDTPDDLRKLSVLL